MRAKDQKRPYHGPEKVVPRLFYLLGVSLARDKQKPNIDQKQDNDGERDLCHESQEVCKKRRKVEGIDRVVELRPKRNRGECEYQDKRQCTNHAYIIAP